MTDVMTPAEFFKLTEVFFEDIWNEGIWHKTLPGNENT
jgi:hypothetical protein